MREFNLRERAEIYSIAQECSKSLTTQPLIDYFNNVYITKFQNGTTLGNSIVNKYFPESNEVFRRTVIDMMIDYTFAFEHVIGNDIKKEIAQGKVVDILKKYIIEDKEYLFYEQGMYPNFVKKEKMIELIVNDLFHQKECDCGSSCGCGMEGDNSGLDKEGCSCSGGSCKTKEKKDTTLI